MSVMKGDEGSVWSSTEICSVEDPAFNVLFFLRSTGKGTVASAGHHHREAIQGDVPSS